ANVRARRRWALSRIVSPAPTPRSQSHKECGLSGARRALRARTGNRARTRGHLSHVSRSGARLLHVLDELLERLTPAGLEAHLVVLVAALFVLVHEDGRVSGALPMRLQ